MPRIRTLAIVRTMIDDDLKQVLAELAETNRQTALRFQELVESRKQVDREFDELAESGRQVDRRLDELARQIGGLGNKFGTFTEGLVWSSLQRILREQLGLHTLIIIPARRRLPDGRELEVDMLGWNNGTDNRIAVVEIKSRLNQRDLDPFDRILRHLGDFFPEHRGKAAVGVIAAIDIRPPMDREVNRRGFHLAKASDENFELADAPGFRPLTVTV